MRATIRCVAAIVATAVGAIAIPATASAAPAPTRVATVIAHDCRDLGITIDLTPEQAARAASLLPSGFRLTPAPTLLVETSHCASATVDGKPIGEFGLSESALSIQPPHTIVSRQITPEIAAENIFMLSQLDTNALLSQTKKKVGYPAELTTITLSPPTGTVPQTLTASAGGTIAPVSERAQLTPPLLPRGSSVPNPGIVYKLWAKDSSGHMVVTTNSNFTITSPAAGRGIVTAPSGSAIDTLLGGPATGVAFAGGAATFVNDTYVYND